MQDARLRVQWTCIGIDITDKLRTIKKSVTGIVFARSHNARVGPREPRMLLDLLAFTLLPLTSTGKLRLFDVL